LHFASDSFDGISLVCKELLTMTFRRVGQLGKSSAVAMQTKNAETVLHMLDHRASFMPKEIGITTKNGTGKGEDDDVDQD
jgi:hypothetical protein